jgi:hypothetical protein
MSRASGFEPPISWSRTKNKLIDSVSLNKAFVGFLKAKLDPNMDPINRDWERIGTAFLSQANQLEPYWLCVMPEGLSF